MDKDGFSGHKLARFHHLFFTLSSLDVVLVSMKQRAGTAWLRLDINCMLS